MNDALHNIITWDQLQDYLLDRMDYADSTRSEANPNFTKEQMWSMYMGETFKHSGE